MMARATPSQECVGSPRPERGQGAVRARIGGSGRHASCVTMMKRTYLRDLDDLAHLGRLICAGLRAVMLE